MNKNEILNFMIWQIKNRIPNGGLYERAISKKEFSDDDLRYYIYFQDLYSNKLLRWFFGNYLINDYKIQEFYKFLDKNFLNKENNCYEFDIDGTNKVKIPIPDDKDKKVYKMELFDLILPYVVGYPKINFPFHEGPYEYKDVTLKKDDIVLDLGANFGMFSAFASQKGCNVHAFEPTYETVDKYLSKTALLNPNIKIIDKAVSNISGIQEFTIDQEDCRCNGISKTKTNLLKHKENKIVIPTITIDKYVNDNNLKSVDFIKSDIEGAERLMLEGAKDTLKEFAPNLSICYYHLLDDKKVLTDLILSANPDYEIKYNWKKIYAYSKKKHPKN